MGIGQVTETKATMDAEAKTPVESTKKPRAHAGEGDFASGVFEESSHAVAPTQSPETPAKDRIDEVQQSSTHITELQQMTMSQLLQAAIVDGMPEAELVGLKKQDLIFQILKARTRQNGLMFGEGTLETLPDGF